MISFVRRFVVDSIQLPIYMSLALFQHPHIGVDLCAIYCLVVYSFDRAALGMFLGVLVDIHHSAGSFGMENQQIFLDPSGCRSLRVTETRRKLIHRSTNTSEIPAVLLIVALGDHEGGFCFHFPCQR